MQHARPVPKAVSGFDGMTERLRAIDVPVVAKVTDTITLVGHLIFGLVLGLAFLKAPRGRQRSAWPWPPLSESAPAKRVIRFAKKVTNSP